MLLVPGRTTCKIPGISGMERPGSILIIIKNFHRGDPENYTGTQRFLSVTVWFSVGLVCTEYMARKHNSLFTNIMSMLKEQNIGAINWGLVSGKTNTIYAWDTPIPDGSEPEL